MRRSTGVARRWFVLAVAALVVSPAFSFCGDEESRFEWFVQPSTATGQLGEPLTFEVQVKSKHEIDAKVFLRATGVPEGATATFDPAVLPGTGDSSTLTIATSTGMTPGSYRIDVFAQEEGQDEESRAIELVLVEEEGAADFALEVDPIELTIDPDLPTRTLTYRMNPVGGLHGEITVEVAWLSDDLVLVQPPKAVTVGEGGFGSAGGTFVVRFEPTGPVDEDVTITVTASGQGVTHSRTMVVHLPVEAAAPTAPET